MNLGASAPTPGTNDISQLSTQGSTTWPDGINYFSNNNPPVGQTFTTGTNAMRLTSLAIKTAGLNSGGNYGNPTITSNYYLRIYSISNTTATFLIAFKATNPGFTDGAWLQWTGLNVPLATNRTYAFTFGIPNDASWVALAVATNKYAGGEIVTVPINGGTIATGSSHTFDAVFNLGLQPAPTNPPASMPFPQPTYGFNLGNSLEAVWGFTYPTAAPLYSAANAGFNAVRIPVAWNHNATTNVSGGVTNYPINAAFMAKVKQTVDNALDAGMYVVVNIHWDDGWLENNITNYVDPVIDAKMKDYWTQIATTFAGYDNRLLFAAANEPNVHSPDEMKTLMYYYQTFVNAVRAVGGQNTNRWLVIQAGGDTQWLNALPTDPVPNRIMVEYHNYTPSQFTMSWGSAFYFWGPAYYYSGDPSRNATWGLEGYIDAGFQTLADIYTSKGIPVMIGEFGAFPAGLTNTTEAAWNKASTLYWDKYVAESARARGFSPFYWSTPGSPIDFSTGVINDSQLVAALTGGTAPPPPNGAPYAPSGLTATGGNGQVSLSWTAGSGATSYDLYRSAESGYQDATPVVTGISGTNYTDTGLDSGTTYYYRVCGVNDSGQSGFAPEAWASTPGVNPDPAQYHFETDVQGWYSGGGIIAGIASSNAQAYAGNRSLAVNFNSATSGYSSITVNDLAVPPGATITFRVWLPSGHKVSYIKPIVQDYNWVWTQSGSGSFNASNWNTLTITVPSTATIPLKRLNLEFTTSAGWTNTCYVDSISWNNVTPDFNLAVSPASLTINAGANSNSTVTVTATNGLNAAYTLSVSNLPPGVSATFTNNPNTGGQSLLTLTASNNVTSGTTNVTVIATAGLISHTQTVALTLNGAAPTPIKVACVGDSITAGYGLANPGTQSYPAQLQALLGSGYTVSNYGDSGRTVLKVSDYSYWNSWGLTSSSNANPDIVVIMFGANDSKSWNWNAANFNADYRALISLYTNLPAHPKVFICYTPPMYLPTAFGTTFDPVFIENTVEPAIATVATQAGVQLIDDDTPLINRPDLFQDGVHPTTNGAAIIAQQVANAIQGLAPTNITTAAITTSGTPSVYGAPVTFTATLTSSAGTVTGAVVFAANNVPFSTNTLVGGTASVTNSQLPIGANVVAAQYVSQGKFLGSTRSVQQIVTDPNGPILYNLGGTAPVPGPNDIAQLSVAGSQSWPDGLNYYTDNGAPSGQTFTTPAKTLNLVTVAIKTAGLSNDGGNYGSPANTPMLYLRLYSMSGTNATLLQTFSAPNPGYTDGAWLRWSNINVALSPSQTYAYSFGNKPDAGGWAALSVASGNTYAGGEIALIPISGGGVTTGGSHSFDATFVLGMVGNTAPVLAAITNRTVNVGQTVAFTASATDTDTPPQTLTFSLLAGATNATLNPNSGAFNFRPLVTQADSTNNFTLMVADNGTPSLSTTQSFTVTVKPLSAPAVSSVAAAGGQISLSVSGQSGPDYAVETSTNLTQWSTVLITNSPALPFTWMDDTTNSPQRFYRIKLGPPLP